jgi:hypothetical protein
MMLARNGILGGEMKNTLFALALCGCAAGTATKTSGIDTARAPGGADTPASTWAVDSTVILDSDGPGGVETYALIRGVFGPDSIEAPDLFANNHPGVAHIREDSDGIVGNHFVFLVHRDLDWDRDTYPATTDRQRNEIKTYDGSAESLKAYEGETFMLTWKFKINATMPVSKNFSHFFQLKGVGGDEQQPLVTFTGAKKGGVDVFEVRFSPASAAPDQFLAAIPWSDLRGQWISAKVQATFAQQGSIQVLLKGEDQSTLVDIQQAGLDLWREGSFIRPKWGIYRSLADAADLRPDEEAVGFAHFSISKLVAMSTP